MSTKGISNRNFALNQAAKKKAPVEKEKVQRQQRPQRARGVGGAHAPGAADPAAEDHADPGAAGVGEVGGSDELHRRRSGEVEEARELLEEEEVEEVEHHDDTGAVGVDGVKRGGGGSGDRGNSDGFDQGQRQREAYERMLKGNVKDDHDRFAELRAKGLKDNFHVDTPPAEVEKQGMPRMASHVVRLFDALTLQGVKHEDAVAKMAEWMSGLSTTTTIKKLLVELESKPIRDVYPLELLMHLLEHRPELLPGVKKGSVLGNSDELADGRKVLAGYPTSVQLPPEVRLKSFALLGGGRPGYEFHPTPNDDLKYTLLIDTPGRWKFAVLAVPLVSLGRISKEGNEGILEVFEVAVHAMGKKGEPITPEAWLSEQAALAAVDDEEEDDDDDGVAAVADDFALAPPAPLLIVQIRNALTTIAKDATTSTQAATYSWDVRFYQPGAPAEGDGILHLVVDKAGPFDPVWARAREAIMHKQREYEPGRALITQEDVASALRRARARD
jgi:hypothetical protein